ncbi:DNA repair protein RecO C-terminal domain-containing protein [Halobacteriovorax sp. RZ-1]|uniref:DNA repair protein RecO n=1 Tax=unclassified Halobacteriovorax TaxID=2639665 RepID=UPI00371CED29
MVELEGILINKIPYQDKHLIGNLLLRNGNKISVMFYGGQGGGKKKVSSILQVGYLFKVGFGRVKNSFEILTSKDHVEKWCHKNISHSPMAFYLLCFFCEFCQSFAPQITHKDDLDLSEKSHEGIFRLLSNAIFRLESRVLASDFNANHELFIFLVKAMVELGIFPRTETCAVSGVEIGDNDFVSLSIEQGGFIHFSHLSLEEQRLVNGQEGKDLRSEMLKVAASKYSEYQVGTQVQKSELNQLVNYICYHQHVQREHYKSLSLLL